MTGTFFIMGKLWFNLSGQQWHNLISWLSDCFCSPQGWKAKTFLNSGEPSPLLMEDTIKPFFCSTSSLPGLWISNDSPVILRLSGGCTWALLTVSQDFSLPHPDIKMPGWIQLL